jgi:hypothetical protein
MAGASVERERLAAATPSELARRVRDAVASVDEARARGSLRVLDRLRRERGLEALERVHVVHPRAGLLVTNLSRLPVREIVFDGGPPVAFDILAPSSAARWCCRRRMDWTYASAWPEVPHTGGNACARSDAAGRRQTCGCGRPLVTPFLLTLSARIIASSRTKALLFQV